MAFSEMAGNASKKEQATAIFNLYAKKKKERKKEITVSNSSKLVEVSYSGGVKWFKVFF